MKLQREKKRFALLKKCEMRMNWIGIDIKIFKNIITGKTKKKPKVEGV